MTNTKEIMETRIDNAAYSILEMCHWDPENVKKKEQIKGYLRSMIDSILESV